MNRKTAPPDLDIAPFQAYFAEQPDVILAYLFGSVARGQADAMSDIDFAVLLQPGLSQEASLERQLEILVALDPMTTREAQVTLLNQAPPLLAFQVIRDGIPLYARSQDERINFEVLAMKRYADVKPMLEFFNQALIQRVKEGKFGQRKRSSASTLEAARRVHQRLKDIPGY